MRKLIWGVGLLFLLCTCTDEKPRPVNITGLAFDTISVDTTCVLIPADSISPKCSLSISLQIAKGKEAQRINQAILSADILMPGYVDYTKTTSPRQYVDSFVCHYINDYKRDYAPLYLDDKENATSYDDIYNVSTSTQMTHDGLICYIASISHFGGGTRPTQQTLVRNIDVKTGKVLTLDSVFNHGYEQKLNAELTKALCKKFKVANMAQLAEKNVLVDGKIYAPDNFILFKHKIQFIYNPDEIAPHDIGEIKIDVSYKALKGLTQQNF